MLKAIKEDDEEALTAMIKAGKNLSEPNKEGWLPLHEAAYYGQLNCLKALHRGEVAGRAAATGGTGTHGWWHFPSGALAHNDRDDRGQGQGTTPPCRVKVSTSEGTK